MIGDTFRRLRPAVGDDDHVLGSGRAPVTLVLFGDYECPYSRRIDAAIRHGVLRQLPDEVDYVFRHFPLARIHPRALAAALAAEAAGAQGAFWPMHEALFRNQRHLAFRDLERYAADVGLDLDRFRDDVLEGRHSDRIRAHTRSGVGSGVQSLPTVYLNGTQLDPTTHPDWIVDDVRSALRALESRVAVAV